MTWLHWALDVFLHLDKHLDDAAHNLGPRLYLLIFAIVFCETGLVVTPFLPGDTLLFVLGALAATSTAIKLPLAAVVLCLAANCGDLVNYTLGYRLGPKVFSRESSWLLNKKHLAEAQNFYDRYGAMTIILARFVPIIRTFAPFVAGIGKMRFARFALFSITGGIFWVVSVLSAGYFFGNIPIVKNNFEIVVLAIVFISVLPPILHWLKARSKKEIALDPIPKETTVDSNPPTQ
ncbi:MAG TPA: VTT domain-containing protein [Tepidisphaeraceae bacterium]|jgi:membrane-associated protein